MSYLRSVSPQGYRFFPDPNVRWLGDTVKAWNGKDRAWMAILGIPFDGGTVSHRRGSRTAPTQIRANLYTKTNYMVEHDTDIPPDRIYDYGDLDVLITDFDETMRRLAAAASSVYGKSDHVLALGGDHSISYELIRAAKANAKGEIGLVQFDAHHDTRIKWATHSGFWLRQLLEEKILQPGNIVQIGIRGSLYSKHYMNYLRDNKIQIISAWDLHENGLDAAMAKTMKQLASTDEIYLTFDIDAIDQAYAPGTDYPSPGGLTSNEAIHMTYNLASRHNVRWMDIMETSPPLDINDQTIRVAAELAAQYIHARVGQDQG